MKFEIESFDSASECAEPLEKRSYTRKTITSINHVDPFNWKSGIVQWELLEGRRRSVPVTIECR